MEFRSAVKTLYPGALALVGVLAISSSAYAGDCAPTPGFLEIRDWWTGACGQFEFNNADWSQFSQRREDGTLTGFNWQHSADHFENHGRRCSVEIHDVHDQYVVTGMPRGTDFDDDDYGDGNVWVFCD